MGLVFEDIEEGADVRLNCFVYGDSGSGKTAFLGTAQDCEWTSPLLIIDIDGGMQTLRGSGIKIIRPKSMKEIQEIYDWLRFENKRYKAVGIDSITELQRKLSMGEILGVLDDDFSYNNLDKHVPADRYDWLSSGEQVKRTLRAFRDLAYLPDDPEHRIHVFMVALERFDEKSSTVCPSLPGALGLEVGASVDILGRLTVRSVQAKDGEKEARHLQLRTRTGDDGVKVLGKVRVPVGAAFPKGIYNPTVEKLVKYWMEPAAEPEPQARKPKQRRSA